MSYALRFASQTKKEFKSLDKGVQKFILDSLDELTRNYSDGYEAELLRVQKLKKLKGEWSGFYRLRLRSYRVIYEKIEEKLVIHVVRVAHRKDAYQ